MDNKEGENGRTEKKTDPPPGGERKYSFWTHPAVIWAGAIAIGILVYWGVDYLVFHFTHETTDDAFLDANVVSIAPQVSGQVQDVYVTDNQMVEKGDLLVEIDARVYKAKAAQKKALVQINEANVKTAESALAAAKSQVKAAQDAARASQAAVESAQASADLANENLKRGRTLREQHTISAQEFDRLRTAAETATANLKAARQNAAAEQSRVARAEAQLQAAQTALESAQAQVKQARAELESAQLDVDYARISAPAAGRVTQKQIAAGTYVTTGQRLLALVPQAMWVKVKILKNRNFTAGTALVAVVGAVLYGTTVALPILMQTLMGYPALQSGLALSPRGIGAFVATMLVGRLVGLVPNRWLIAVGFVLLAVSSFQLAQINLQAAMSNIIWPTIINGIGITFIFIPLTTSAMGHLRQEQMGNATGIYNLMRSIGGSFGIALVATMLARRAQIHQAFMVAHLTPYDPVYQNFLAMARSALSMESGPVEGAQQAQGLIYQLLVRQAKLWAFVENFQLFGYLSLSVLPLLLLLKSVRGKKRMNARE